ncbi:Major facilitator superfamily [Macrophomina phaseolina MS6]|uniref:Major facilitator superfamily n=1 Tax=Macrophomina phaseolina (strain MS6) TaxID=1126212 RepID=K2S2Z8_MACPH|nr:Major facilitator superfamily [Macrophomina phaseolina MS6]
MASPPEKQETTERLSAPAPSELERGGATPNSDEFILAKDGTVLVPQPSSSPDDPLNWSWAKKHIVLCALIPGCLLSDWALTWGSVLFQLQAPEWHMSVTAVSQSMSPGIFMQGPGGILAVPLCQRYGRLPVLFWSQLLSLIVTIGATFADSYASFTAMRTLQGFFGAAPQVIGLSIIHDMFFFHERARKINIWAASFLIGPYLGPFFSSLLVTKLNWRQDFGVLAGFYGLSLLMVVLLGDETLYDRNVVAEKPKNKSILRHLSLLFGIEGARVGGRPGLWTVTKHQYSLLARPYLFAPTALFVMPLTMWTIGLVSTISQFVLPPPPPMGPGYGFTYISLAMIHFAPMIGTLLAEFWGHWFNDFIATRYIKRHGGTHMAENRLNGVYIPVIIGVGGLVLFGETLQHHLTWVGLAFGWGMTCFATLGGMTAISAYVLDCFPHHAAPASAWINFWRVIGGFTVTYFQMDWVSLNGPAVTFGCQAAIIAGATAAVTVTQVWGERWRAKWPAPAAEN